MSQKDGSIIEGSENQIVNSSYRFVLGRHDDPDMALTGHYWEVLELQKIGEVAQLV